MKINYKKIGNKKPDGFYINQHQLDKLVDEKVLRKRTSEDEKLFLYNYTQTCQYNQNWNDFTLISRGLILDKNGKVIAFPFTKFFNFEEHINHQRKIPKEPFKVFDKMDGSLGICYYYNNKWNFSTRGSFNSDQSKIGEEILYSKYKKLINNMNKDLTYLFEIIYPENKIVVDYGKMRDLILLGAINKKTLEEIDLEKLNKNFQKTQIYNIKTINDLLDIQSQNEKNKEGFVIKFQSGLRLKVKLQNYIELHRIATKRIYNTHIWENLKNGKTMEDLIEVIPDELYGLIKSLVKEYQQSFQKLKKECDTKFKKTILEIGDYKGDPKVYRKIFAKKIFSKGFKNPGILFLMLDGKNEKIQEAIWNGIKPEQKEISI